MTSTERALLALEALDTPRLDKAGPLRSSSSLGSFRSLAPSSPALVPAQRPAMSSAWELYLTPSLTLSLLLEAESPLPSLARWLSQLALYFRPALLRQALAYEQEQRPEGEVVGAGTLRVVDYAVWRLAQQSQVRHLGRSQRVAAIRCGAAEALLHRTYPREASRPPLRPRR